MGLNTLKIELELPISIEEAWAFFSSPKNLNEITPEDMSFEILTDLSSEKMYPGMLIEYYVRPIANIPMNWVTEITHVEHHKYFVDEQRFGPYAMWHHEHHFEETKTGVLMTDILTYKVGMGPLGSLANWLFVKNKVNGIFEFRTKKLKQMFPG